MKIKIIYSFIALGIVAVISSCNKSQNDICDINQICYTEQPNDLYIRINLSSNPSNEPIELSLYKGYFDDGELYDSFFTTESIIYYLMPVGERYTATAKYKRDGIDILVLDSDYLTANSYENCEETCYDYEQEIVMDLQLEE